MKRYRVMNFQFDTRANILRKEIEDNWEMAVKEQWEQNKRQIIENLMKQLQMRYSN